MKYRYLTHTITLAALILGTAVGAASAQSITLTANAVLGDCQPSTLTDVPAQMNPDELAIAGTDIQIDILVHTSGLTLTRLLSATVDFTFDETDLSVLGWAPWTGDIFGGFLQVRSYSDWNVWAPTAYTITPSNLAGYYRISVVNTSAATAGTVVGPTPIRLLSICLDDATAAPATALAVAQTSIAFRPEAISVSFIEDSGASDVGTTETCTGDGTNANVGACNFVTSDLLPVELADFGAILDGEDVVLNWSTASEDNNAGFYIEHARGTDEFAELGFVEGNGTTTRAVDYVYRASGLDIGRHRFRLKQVDFDGGFEYHPEVETTIELAGTHRLGAAYPNPFNPQTTFELIVGETQNVKIDILNALGQRVHTLYEGSVEAQEPTNFAWRASSLPTGLYFYRVVGEKFHQVRQMVLVK